MMSKNAAYKSQRTRYSIAVGALLVFASIGTATAQQMGAMAQQRYQQELAACGSGRSSQDVATCQKEARNALEEASRGGLSNAPNAAQTLYSAVTFLAGTNALYVKPASVEKGRCRAVWRAAEFCGRR